MLSPVAKKVIGVEIIEEAVEAAKENAQLNGLHNCEFIAGMYSKSLTALKKSRIILYLIHQGMESSKSFGKNHSFTMCLRWFIFPASRPVWQEIWKFLQARGYEVKKICCVDMFPSTVHVETVVGLHRKDM